MGLSPVNGMQPDELPTCPPFENVATPGMTRRVAYPATEYDPTTILSDEPNPANGGAHRYQMLYKGEPVGFLQFQNGPRNTEGSITGLFQMQVLAAMLDQYRGFQTGPYANANTEAIIEHLQAAFDLSRERRDERAARGALGKNVT